MSDQGPDWIWASDYPDDNHHGTWHVAEEFYSGQRVTLAGKPGTIISCTTGKPTLYRVMFDDGDEWQGMGVHLRNDENEIYSYIKKWEAYFG